MASGFWEALVPLAVCPPAGFMAQRSQSMVVLLAVAYGASRLTLHCHWCVSLRRGLSAFISRITAVWTKRPVAATAVVSSGNNVPPPALTGGLAVIISERGSTQTARSPFEQDDRFCLILAQITEIVMNQQGERVL